MKLNLAKACLVLAGLDATLNALAADSLPLSQIRLPPGFEINVFAKVPNARQMALGKQNLFVGSMGAGNV